MASQPGRRSIRHSIVERMIDEGVIGRIEGGEQFNEICREYGVYPSNVFSALKHPSRRVARHIFRKAMGDHEFDKILDPYHGDQAPDIRPTPEVKQAKFHVELPPTVTALMETLSSKTGWDVAYIVAGTVERHAATWCKEKLRQTLDNISDVESF